MAGWEEAFETVVAPAVRRSRTIREVMMARGALRGAGAMVRRHFEGGRVVVFADEAGFAAAGEPLVGSLEAAGLSVVRHVIAARPLPKPTTELAESFRAPLKRAGAVPVALGSGVINDLVKHAACVEGLPYLSVATAASMDGYASAGAPLISEGFKITIPARAPRAILADLEVIAAAPPEMTSWGYGDLAGKVPAGGDWLVADALEIEPLDDAAWPLVQHNLRGWLAGPEALARGDFAAIARLFSGLTAVGLAMEFHGSSRPASGADHQIAHLWEMQGLEHGGRRVSHGACVAVGCMAVLQLYDWLLERDLERIDAQAVADAAPTLARKFAEIETLFDDPRIIERAREETRAKHLEGAALAERLELLRARWPGLRDRLRAHLMPAGQMAGLLRAAGAPVSGAEIGVDPARMAATLKASRFIRARYTLPDLLEETGLLTQAVQAVAGQGDGTGGQHGR